ncbi:MAG: hypothetical protein DRI95_15360 [Bacteroidetes bacterium]|nr:MAG: hypothetical protein DRI95_15360 [Bacteroidota bacterium]
MKKHFIFIFFLTNVVFAQKYNRATYDIKIDKTKLSKFMLERKLDIDVQQLTLYMVDGANRSSLLLYFNKESSLCQVEEELSLGNNIPVAKGVLTFLNVADDIYYNSKVNTYYEKRGSDDYTHLAKLDAMKIDWKLAEETKNVKGYNYRKATATFLKNEIEYQVQAWFCPNIPVQLGPSFFNGLPGLISEVYVTSDESEFNYNYILRKLDNDRKIGDINPPIVKYNILTEEESEELFSKVNEGFNN